MKNYYVIFRKGPEGVKGEFRLELYEKKSDFETTGVPEGYRLIGEGNIIDSTQIEAMKKNVERANRANQNLDLETRALAHSP